MLGLLGPGPPMPLLPQALRPRPAALERAGLATQTAVEARTAGKASSAQWTRAHKNYGPKEPAVLFLPVPSTFQVTPPKLGSADDRSHEQIGVK